MQEDQDQVNIFNFYLIHFMIIHSYQEMCGPAVWLQPPAFRGPSGKGGVIITNLELKLKIFYSRSNTAESLTVTQSSLTSRTLGVSSDFLIMGLIDEFFSKNLNVIVSISQINTTIISTKYAHISLVSSR